MWGECNEGQYRNRTRQATVVLIKLQEYESNGSSTIAQVAKLEESQSEDMNVPGSSPGLGIFSYVNPIPHIDLHSSGMSPILRLMKVLLSN